VPLLCLILCSYAVPPGLLTRLKYLMIAQVINKIVTSEYRDVPWSGSLVARRICGVGGTVGLIRIYDRSIQNNGIRPTQFQVMYQ
jgi:hypothetical protein